MQARAEPYPALRGQRGRSLLTTCLTTPQPPAPPARSKGGERGLGPRETGPRLTEQAAERRGPPGQGLPAPAPTVPQRPGGPTERALVAARAPLKPSTHHSWWPRGSHPPFAGPGPSSGTAQSRADQSTHSSPGTPPRRPGR